jgi:peroxiredoxin Q/BCP
MSDVLPIGSRAPEFEAPASDGTTYRLADLLHHGHVALVFYPGNDTPGCNRQLSAARDEMAKFERAGIRPFGVNHASIDSHRKYVEKMGFNFPLLSDPDRAIARAYHALKDDDRGIARTVYVVARDGTIRLAERGAPSVDAMVAALEGRA